MHAIATSETADTRVLFGRIADFLEDNRLDPDPVNYAFAYQIATDHGGPLSHAVAAMTDGGVRLTRRDIETLGGEVAVGARVVVQPQSSPSLVAETQVQLESFHTMMRTMRVETSDFGRDLAASADAIRLAPTTSETAELVRITSAMMERVRSAESRLEVATNEASELRARLEEARDHARRDPLTNLPNRRAVEEAFAQQAKAGVPICLAVCDVDRFKAVNDRFGHQVGDRVLKAIAGALEKACPEQIVGRYGGEEFVVLFIGLDAATALETIDAARELIAAKRFRLRESAELLGAVTFSAGLVEVAVDENCASAFARADALLYEAKADGRNRVKAG